jgi:hypothetical protein
MQLFVLHVDSVLKVHNHVGTGIHLLTCKVELLMGEVPPMPGLTKAVVHGLQFQVQLCRLTCPMTEVGILMLKTLHRMRCEGSLLGVRVQTCVMLGYDSACVVLQVEQVHCVLGQT